MKKFIFRKIFISLARCVEKCLLLRSFLLNGSGSGGRVEVE
jgi:hypothetical protein